MPESYARAILKLLEKGEEPKDAVAQVREVLQRSGRSALLPHVARAFKRVFAGELKKRRSVLVVARKEDERAARKAANAEGAELLIDETLIGGWRFEDKEELTDASWKKHLLTIYGKVTTS